MDGEEEAQERGLVGWGEAQMVLMDRSKKKRGNGEGKSMRRVR